MAFYGSGYFLSCGLNSLKIKPVVVVAFAFAVAFLAGSSSDFPVGDFDNPDIHPG